MNFSEMTSVNSTEYSDLDVSKLLVGMQYIKQAKEELDAAKKYWDQSGETVKCPTCGRSPFILDQDGFQSTLFVCPHLWEELRKLCKEKSNKHNKVELPPLSGLHVQVTEW